MKPGKPLEKRTALGRHLLGEVSSGHVKVVLLLLALEHFGPMGRKHLSSALNLPEGVVRGLVARLRRAGLIETSQEGCYISALGLHRLRAELQERGVESLSDFPGESLGIGPVVVSAHVKKASGKVRLGIEERDLSIRAGSKGAVTLTYSDGRLSMPGVSGDLLGYEPQSAQEILSRLELKDGDVVLLVFADDYYRAFEGALLAASTLAPRKQGKP